MTPLPTDCLGIPVCYLSDFNGISDSRGLWRWKKIVVGPTFTRFPPREQAAMLLHEVGHCKLYHLEKRLLRLWRLLWHPSQLAAYCMQQEFEADRFVSGCGYGADLARAFSRLTEGNAALHPPLSLRIERLTSI